MPHTSSPDPSLVYLKLRIYKFWEKPVGMCSTPWICLLPFVTRYPELFVRQGPHPTAMFEVNTFNPHQTGAFFSWLTVNRGPCSYVSSSISAARLLTFIAPLSSALLTTSELVCLSSEFLLLFNILDGMATIGGLSMSLFCFVSRSVLIHPNTGDAYKDHTELMTWIGKPWPLLADMLKPH